MLEAAAAGVGSRRRHLLILAGSLALLAAVSVVLDRPLNDAAGPLLGFGLLWKREQPLSAWVRAGSARIEDGTACSSLYPCIEI